MSLNLRLIILNLKRAFPCCLCVLFLNSCLLRRYEPKKFQLLDNLATLDYTNITKDHRDGNYSEFSRENEAPFSPEISDLIDETLADKELDGELKSLHPEFRVHNAKVQQWMKYFLEKQHKEFQRALDRGSQYKRSILHLLDKNGMPAELYYLPVIESYYGNHARSRASAVGIWQFIHGTGVRYGLKINNYIDERRDPLLSSQSAILYLQDLYRVFQSWSLALAAYNAGEGRIVNAIFRANSRDYWEIVRKKMLPRETQEYVAKFIAAINLARDSRKYGFKSSADLEWEYETVKLPPLIPFRTIAKVASVSLKEIKNFNPAMRRSTTPPYAYKIRVPIHKKAMIVEKLGSLSKVSRKNIGLFQKRQFHKVRRGENLFLIARKYKISIRRLKRINSLRSNLIHPGKLLKVRG